MKEDKAVRFVLSGKGLNMETFWRIVDYLRNSMKGVKIGARIMGRKRCWVVGHIIIPPRQLEKVLNTESFKDFLFGVEVTQWLVSVSCGWKNLCHAVSHPVAGDCSPMVFRRNTDVYI